MKIEKWNIEEETGYKPITTFWEDFTIADKFGINAVADTYYRAFNEWKNDYKYMTELSLVLNHKIWRYYENEHTRALAQTYDSLWKQLDTYLNDNLKEDELDYYYRITD